MTRNNFKHRNIEYSDPGRLGAKVTKSDTVDIADGVPRGFLVGTAGSATLLDIEDNEREDVPLQQGYNPIRDIKRVMLGGTADDIWPYY